MRFERDLDPAVYILASKPNGILYLGATSDLSGRMVQHREGEYDGFTKRYGIKTLVYYEMHDAMTDAIVRERRMKEWQRAWKVRLILAMNPQWRDLFDPATGDIADGPADIERRGP